MLFKVTKINNVKYSVALIILIMQFLLMFLRSLTGRMGDANLSGI